LAFFANYRVLTNKLFEMFEQEECEAVILVDPC